MMPHHQTLYAIYFVALIVYIAGMRLVLWRLLSPFQRRVFLALNVPTFIIYSLFHFSIMSRPHTLPFWNWFLDVNEEFGLIATYSSMILLVTGAAALGLAVLGRWNGWQRAFWLMTGALFVFLALDEYYLIHETVYLLTGIWQVLYITLGVTVVLLSTAFWWRGWGRDWTLLFLYLVGLAVIGGSGIGLDYFFQEVVCLKPGLNTICYELNLIEEILETLGACFVLAVFVRMARDVLPRPRRYWRMLWAVGVLWLVWAVGYWWVFPGLELRLDPRIRPVEMSFDDGRFTLLGYRIDTHSIHSGQTLRLALYWRTSERIGALYQQSVHILTQEYESIGQDDPDANWFPSYAWFPGFVIRQDLNIPIEELPATPYGYHVSLRLWKLLEPDAVLHEIRGELPLLFDDTFQLTTVTALSDGPLPGPPQAHDFRFGEQFTLYGYEIPAALQAGEGALLRFWWQGDGEGIPDYRQYLHLLAVDETSGQEPVVFDQIPAGGALPTANWIEGLQFVDEWEIVLPDDIVPGLYEVVTGFFHQVEGGRLPLVGEAGAVRDNGVILGRLEVAAGGE